MHCQQLSITRYPTFYILCFFFNATATTKIYTLSLHDALPIYLARTIYAPWSTRRRAMVSDTEARNAVRQLMKRFDLIQAQHLGLAYVLAKRDAAEYAQLLDSAERVIPTVIQPAAEADVLHSQVYAALDNPSADWCKAVLSMLNQGPIEHAW